MRKAPRYLRNMATDGGASRADVCSRLASPRVCARPPRVCARRAERSGVTLFEATAPSPPAFAGAGSDPLPKGRGKRGTCFSPETGVPMTAATLGDRGYVYKRATRDPGRLLENPTSTEQVRIMKRPMKGPSKSEPPQKFYFQHYYRYRGRDDSKWGEPVPIPDKAAD